MSFSVGRKIGRSVYIKGYHLMPKVLEETMSWIIGFEVLVCIGAITLILCTEYDKGTGNLSYVSVFLLFALGTALIIMCLVTPPLNNVWVILGTFAAIGIAYGIVFFIQPILGDRLPGLWRKTIACYNTRCQKNSTIAVHHIRMDSNKNPYWICKYCNDQQWIDTAELPKNAKEYVRKKY